MTHDELAALTLSDRASVTRALHQLQNDGLVTLGLPRGDGEREPPRPKRHLGRRDLQPIHYPAELGPRLPHREGVIQGMGHTFRQSSSVVEVGTMAERVLAAIYCHLTDHFIF